MKRTTKIAMALMAAKTLALVFIASGCYKVEEKTIIKEVPTISGTESYTKVVNDYAAPEDKQRDDPNYWDYQNEWTQGYNGVVAATSSDGLWTAVERGSMGNDAEFDLIGPNGVKVLVRHANAFEFSPDNTFITYHAYLLQKPGDYCKGMLRKIDLTTLEDAQISLKGVDCADSNDEASNPNSLPWMGVATKWEGHTATYVLPDEAVTINFDTGEITRTK